MGPNAVVVVGFLVAFVEFAAATELLCDTPSGGAAKCEHDLAKDQILHIKCPTTSTFVPPDAFGTVTGKVCKVALTDAGVCSEDKELKQLIPGAAITRDDDNVAIDFKISNTKELTEDTTIYASCKDTNGNSLAIAIKFLKGGGVSDASSRATMPAVLLGILTTIVTMFRA